MARFIQLISPILHHPAPGRFSLSRSVILLWSITLAWSLVISSFYFYLHSKSVLLLGVASVQIAFSSLIQLEFLLRKMKAGPLTSRRLEMTAYCLGGAVLLLLFIYQFSEGYVHLQNPENHFGTGLATAAFFSIAGNLVLVRLLWRSGVIRSRIRAFCQPLLGILLLNLISLLSSFVIQITHFIKLDPLLAMLSSIVLFVITTGVMIDAYWHLIDLEMKGLKNRELEIF